MTTPSVSQLKDEANNLFVKHEYQNAVSLFTKAIELDSGNAILFANRAACYAGLRSYQQSLSDAKKATELDPNYAKAWYRLGSAQDALGSYPESIESYQRSQSLTPTNAERQRQIEVAIDGVTKRILDPETMSVDVIKALARAHDIPVPLPHVPENREAISNAVFNHPKISTDPLRLIPESQTEPLRQVELKGGSNIQKEICRLLKCDLTDAVVLHSEDQIAYAQNKPYGVGVGRIHSSYEAFMDDLAVSKRPLNKRACELLVRPRTFGPILVMKTTFIKSQPDIFARNEDILCWERVSEADLKSDHFKKLREEWNRVKGSDDPKFFDVR